MSIFALLKWTGGISAAVGLKAAQKVCRDWLHKHYTGDYETLSAEQRAKIDKDFAQSCRFSQGIPAEEAFNQYIAARKSSLASFTELKAPNGTPLAEALQDTRALNRINDELFTLDEATKEAAAAFTSWIKVFNFYVKDPDSEYDPATLLILAKEEFTKARKALVEQQKKEISRLEDMQNEPALANSIRNTLRIDDTKLDKTYQELKTSLQKAHQEELQKFDKSFNEPVAKLDAELKTENARVEYLKVLYNRNKDARAAIDKAYMERKKRSTGPAEIVLDLENESAYFKNIKIEDIAHCNTLAGRAVQYDDKKKCYTVQLPNTIFSKRYYSDWEYKQHRMKDDLLDLAQRVRAGGAERLEFTVNHATDEAHAKSVAREAYVAGMRAGFDMDKIVIKVNGKEVKSEELFAQNPSLLEKAKFEQANIDRDLGVSRKAQSGSTYATTKAREKLSCAREAFEEQERQEEENRNRPNIL